MNDALPIPRVPLSRRLNMFGWPVRGNTAVRPRRTWRPHVMYARRRWSLGLTPEQARMPLRGRCQGCGRSNRRCMRTCRAWVPA